MTKKKSKAKEPELEDMEDVDMNDVVTDSEEEYTETERRLLEKARTRQSVENYDSDIELYGLQDKEGEAEDDDEEEDEADSMESDIEGLEKDLDLPDERAWGKKKRTYYHTDYVDPDYSSATQKDLAEAEIEEQEARNIQKRLAEQLDDADFGLEFVKEVQDQKHEDTDQIVKTDLTKLSKRQKQVIMQKESPEFAALVNDFKVRMTEARDVLAPFLKLAEKHVIPSCMAVLFVKTKYQLSLNYCVNISFYLMLKAKRLPVNSHPVIKRLAQYRQLLNQLESGQGKLIDEVQEILTAEKQGKPLYNTTDGSTIAKPTSKKELGNLLKTSGRGTYSKKKAEVELLDNEVPDSELAGDNDSETEELDKEDADESIFDDDENDEAIEQKALQESSTAAESDGKRAITYQIAKNRGLTPHRKKELRNPRVKHRNKYRKAKIRRKGAVREVRKEVKRYAGEISGIKAGVKKGIKLK